MQNASHVRRPAEPRTSQPCSYPSQADPACLATISGDSHSPLAAIDICWQAAIAPASHRAVTCTSRQLHRRQNLQHLCEPPHPNLGLPSPSAPRQRIPISFRTLARDLQARRHQETPGQLMPTGNKWWRRTCQPRYRRNALDDAQGTTRRSGPLPPAHPGCSQQSRRDGQWPHSP